MLVPKLPASMRVLKGSGRWSIEPRLLRGTSGLIGGLLVPSRPTGLHIFPVIWLCLPLLVEPTCFIFSLASCSSFSGSKSNFQRDSRQSHHLLTGAKWRQQAAGVRGMDWEQVTGDCTLTS